jgi:hypothetical protein
MAIRSSLVLCIALACSVPAAADAAVEQATARTPADKEKSRAAFRKGVTQLKAQDWVGARASFEAAWALFPHPSILLNLGIARLKTDDPVLAEQDLLRFLAEDPGAAPEELAGAREALAEARARIGTLRVKASPAAARITIDGRQVERVRPAESTVVAEQRVKAGSHAVRVEADGYATDERAVTVAAKLDADVVVALVASERETPSGEDPLKTRRLVGWTLVATGGVALITGVAMALRAASLSDDYGDPANPATFQNPEVRSEGIGFRTGADVAVGLAIVAAGVGLVLLLTNVGVSRAADVAAVRW